MERKHTISVLVENEFGVLARVASLFSSKGYNIDSLSVSETTDPTLSRMTIVTRGSDQIIEQIIKQLDKLVNVLRVEDLTRESHVTQEMFLVKLAPSPELLKVAEKVGARILESNARSVILELTGDEDHLSEALNLLRPLGILEIVRTGAIALQRGRLIEGS